jgi:hypothetical protein
VVLKPQFVRGDVRAAYQSDVAIKSSFDGIEKKINIALKKRRSYSGNVPGYKVPIMEFSAFVYKNILTRR